MENTTKGTEAATARIECDVLFGDSVSAIQRQYRLNYSNARKLKDDLAPVAAALRECLPHIEEVCEADAVGGPGDPCSVNRAMILRDQIYSILANKKDSDE